MPVDQVVRSLFRNYQLQHPEKKSVYAVNTYFVDASVGSLASRFGGAGAP